MADRITPEARSKNMSRIRNADTGPEMTVRRSHELAHQVQLRIKEKLDWVADVLVHVEPGRVELPE